MPYVHTSRRVRRLFERLQRSIWLLPATAMIGGTFAATLTATTEVRVPGLPSILGGLLTTSGPAGARDLVQTVASTSLTVATFVFSVTIVALQVAASQYSPRVPQQFIRDRGTQIVMALFIFCFVYSLATIRTIRADADIVPNLAVTVAFLLALVTVGGFVYFIDHIVDAIKVEHVLRRLEERTREALDRIHAHGPPAELTDTLPVAAEAVALKARRSGILQIVHESELMDLARHEGIRLRMAMLPGEQMVSGAPLAHVWSSGPGPGIDAERMIGLIEDSLTVGDDRLLAYDPAFGLTQIVDIALRAASPAVNDPTTTSNAIRSAEVVLCELCDRDLGRRLLRDDEGDVRLILPGRSLSDYLDMVMTPIRQVAAGDLSVVSRLFRMLEMLSFAAPDVEAINLIRMHAETLKEQANAAMPHRRDAERVRRKAADLLEHLNRRRDELDMGDAA